MCVEMYSSIFSEELNIFIYICRELNVYGICCSVFDGELNVYGIMWLHIWWRTKCVWKCVALYLVENYLSSTKLNV